MSGGSDSILLSYLMSKIHDTNKMIGIIVDHNLRKGSDKEASITSKRLSNLSILFLSYIFWLI